MAKDRVSPTEKLTITDGKIMQEIPRKQLEGRQKGLQNNIQDINDEIGRLQDRKGLIQQDIDDIEALLLQIPKE